MAKLTLKMILSVLSLTFGSLPVFAQTAGETQKIIRSSDQIAADMIAREMIEKKKISPVVDENIAAQQDLEAGPKSLIKNIAVTGVTLLKQEEINKITREYENKELNIRQMQKITDLITGLYRIKGFITSRAYLPPQKLEGGALEIRVLEGITGNVQIRGNRYFKTALIRNKLVYLKTGEPFNYESLRKGLVKINEHPDRNAKAYLMPGQEPGATDIDIEVKDNLPIHAGFDWDNYGSRYINKNRYRLTLTDNNLFGWDDILTLQYQVARGENYVFVNGRYLLPVTPTWKLGFFAARSAVKLRKDFEDLNVRGKSRLYSIYGIKTLVEEQDINLNLNFGFDYKDVFNFQAGDETSRDRMRVLKAGWDLDVSDGFGRTIFTNDLNYGLADFMGGLQKKDPAHASRDGSGGKFVKDTVNLLRLQRMPYDSALLWKNQLQFSPYILTATEQFQIGGIANVRGYPAAELVGDQGYSMTWEWSFPPYLMPKDFKVPFMQANFYDALRLVFFYDWANTRLRRPAAGEQKDRTLRSAGTGLRFNLPNDFSARLEFAWPLDNTPSDGSHLHTWTEISKSF